MNISGKHFCFVASYTKTNEWVDNEVCIEDENDLGAIEALREYLSEPDKYYVELRECNECEDFTLREAYDLAVAHPNDYFEPADMVMYGLTNPADVFIHNILWDIADDKGITEVDVKEASSIDSQAWNGKMGPFLWDRVLSKEEATAECKRFGISYP